MKKINFILALLLIVVSVCFAQTPYYTVKFTIIDDPKENLTYTIVERICEFDYKPVVPSGDYWFGRDTSVLNWGNLPDTMYNLLKCKDMPAEATKVFEEGRQSMIWETIFTFNITRHKAGSAEDTMTIVFPILVKSFVTYINLGGIKFKPGYFELTRTLIYNTKDHGTVTLPEDFTWVSTGFENRKIKLTK